MAETVLGLSALNARLTAVGNAGRSGALLGKLARAAVAQQKELAPKRTGNLRRTIHVGVVTATTAQTVASANYAAYVEYGTAPHEITPRAARALRWLKGGAGARLSGTPTKAAQRGQVGEFLYAKRVHHPGTRAEPYMLPGAKRAVEASPLRDVIVAAWNDAA